MKQVFSVLVFVLIALPFAYMAYDVTKDIYRQLKDVLVKKSRPLLQSVLQMFTN
ncbi:MAG: hypothetical protein J7L94_10130 [Caldisericaceae bacterium]|nr:hypothetical protein [Caldisericaceae bacterium]